MFVISRVKRLRRMVGEGEYRHLLNLLYYRIFTKLRGVDLTFTSIEDLSLSKDIAHYHSDSGGPDLDIVLKSLPISAADSILDIGCGKGGALITLAKYPFQSIAGLEISEKLLLTAKANLSKLRINDIQLFCSDASVFDLLDAYNYMYMFNPFPCNVMNNVINNISLSFSRIPRTITIVYKNPVCHDAILENSDFKLVNEFHHSPHPFFIYRLS
jgi:SAM-dependent methyltransferase